MSNFWTREQGKAISKSNGITCRAIVTLDRRRRPSYACRSLKESGAGKEVYKSKVPRRGEARSWKRPRVDHVNTGTRGETRRRIRKGKRPADFENLKKPLITGRIDHKRPSSIIFPMVRSQGYEKKEINEGEGAKNKRGGRAI